MVKSKRVSKTNFKKRKVNRKKAKAYKKCARTKSMWYDSKMVKAKRTKRNNVKSVKSVQSKRSVRSFNKKSNRIKKPKQSLVKKTKSRRIKSNISVDCSDDDDDDYDDEEDEDDDKDDKDDEDDDDSPPPPKLMAKFTSPASTTSIISISSSVSSPSNVSIDQSQQMPPHPEQAQVKQVQAVKQVSLPKAPPTKLPSTQSTEPEKRKLPQSNDEEIQWEVSNRELEQHEDSSIESVQSSSSTEASLSLEDSITLEVTTPSEESEEEESEEEESEEKEPELPEAVKQYMHSENFTLVKYIVSSTTCSVYKVTNGDGRCRAAKVIDHSALPELIRDSHLPDELAIIRSVRHPNIILTDAILTKLPNYSIIISEFASEGDLTGYIEKTGIDPPDKNLSKKWFCEITNALIYLHQKYIAHRDIKLDNILLFEELTAKLCDFGFATYCRDQKTGAQVLCETYCGTVEYQAPEILLCENPYNGMTADCFSLGVFLYRLLTGHLPFVQNNKSVESTEELTELQARIHAKKWDKIGSIAQDEDLRSLLLQLLNPNTEERIQVTQVLAHRWISRVE